jgi:hypothetical protein
MDWPARSPALNPIEVLWDESERRLRSRPKRPTSLTALLEKWAAIPPETFTHLVETLCGRGGSRIGTMELQHPLLPLDIIDNI